MKRIGIKKILLYISMLPYMYGIVMSIYHSIFGYSLNPELSNGIYGLEAIYRFNINSWIINIVHFNFIGAIIGVCVVYQIYYFIVSEKDKSKIKKISFRKIVLCLSVLCWIWYFLVSLSAFFEGHNFIVEKYSIEAVYSALSWNLYIFSIIPILPITLIYIIIYLIVRYREKRNKNNGDMDNKS